MPDSDAEQFAKDLIKAIRKVPPQTAKVVRKGSINVKQGARRNVKQTAPRRNAHAFRDINYDIEAQGASVAGEIGYDKGLGKVGNLGNLLEFGGGGDHSPPHFDLARALADEEPRFIQALEDMGEDILAGRFDRKVDLAPDPE